MTQFEVFRLCKVMNAFVQRIRPPLSVRDQLDVLWTMEGQSVHLLEVSRLDDGQRHERRFAKATWVRAQRLLNIDWQCADLQWHCYEPVVSVKSIQGFCDAIEADPLACFWG